MQWQRRAAAALMALVATAFLTTGTLAATDTKTTSAIAATKSCPSVPRGTLSFACDNACASNQPCIAADASSSSTGCRCFPTTTTTTTTATTTEFNFLIPFDAATNASLNRANLSRSEKSYGDWDLNKYPWASNDEVTKIAPLDLPKSTTSVSIRGGSSYRGISKGFAASVEIDPKFLATQPQVIDLYLENLKLTNSIDSVVANLPNELGWLEIRNTMLNEFPAGVTKLKAIWSVDMSYNNLQRITPAHAMPDLTSLYARANKITSFTAVYPKLKYLDLDYNKLTSVPDVIAKHSMLERLSLGDNSITVFNQLHVSQSITDLELGNNDLVSFEAYMPRLESLDLSGNSFTAFPSVIFSHAKLSRLYIYDNPKMTNVSFTSEQASFINALASFLISDESLETNCAEEQKHTFRKANYNYTVCITGVKDTAVILGPRIVVSVPDWVSTPSPTSSSTSSPTSALVLPLAIVGSVVLLLLLACIAVLMRKLRNTKSKDDIEYGTLDESDINNHRSKGDTRNNSEQTNHHFKGIQGGGRDGIVSLWDDADFLSFRVGADDVQDIEKLGSGAFADVWLVRFRGAELMASKRLRKTGVDRKHTQDFIDEIKLVAKLSHPSIVELKGVAWIRESDLQALFEYMDRGDLRTYLTNPQVPMQWTVEKLQIAIDVAEALVYAHSFSPPLVHRDLKSRNVLLQRASSGDASENGSGNGAGTSASGVHVRAKLTDFGVSRYQSQENTMTAGVGTSRWLAPEVIAGDSNYGAAADIFSFGVLLSELDTHQIPYADMRDASSNQFAEVAILQRVAAGELVPALGVMCPYPIAQLATRCFALKPADRPAAPEVAYALRTLRKSLGNSHI